MTSGPRTQQSVRRRITVPTDLIALGQISPIQKPDVIHVIHMDSGDLLHAPSVGQRPWPERVHLKDRRAILVHRLHLRLRRTRGKCHDKTNEGGYRGQPQCFFTRIHGTFSFLFSPLRAAR